MDKLKWERKVLPIRAHNDPEVTLLLFLEEAVGTGLAIQKAYRDLSTGETTRGWKVIHLNSGLALRKGFRRKKYAIEFLKTVLECWTGWCAIKYENGQESKADRALIDQAREALNAGGVWEKADAT